MRYEKSEIHKDDTTKGRFARRTARARHPEAARFFCGAKSFAHKAAVCPEHLLAFANLLA